MPINSKKETLKDRLLQRQEKKALMLILLTEHWG